MLRLDAEPKRNFVTKTLLVEGNLLVVTFTGTTRDNQEAGITLPTNAYLFTGPVAKNLRVGVTAFFEALLLSCETMDRFGPAVPQYSHY